MFYRLRRRQADRAARSTGGVARRRGAPARVDARPTSYQTEQDERRVVRLRPLPRCSRTSRRRCASRPTTPPVVRSRCATSTASSPCRSIPPDKLNEAALEDLVKLMMGDPNAFLRRAPLALDPRPRAPATSPRRRAASRRRLTPHAGYTRRGTSSSTATITSSTHHREPAVARALRVRERQQRRRPTPAAARAASGAGAAAAPAARRRCRAPRRGAAAAARAGRSGRCIQRSRNGFAVTHRSRSGSSWRPSPSTASSVFCSSVSCGWISTLNRRDARNSDTSTLPSEISFSGRSKIGSSTTRISASSSSTRVSGRHPSRLDVRRRDATVVAAEEREEVLREVALVASRTACP